MKVRLRIEKDHGILYEQIHDIQDAESFGKACSQAWVKLRERKVAQAANIGALYDELDDQLLDELSDAKFSFARA